MPALVTLFFFKRDFEYYLACFVFWFYLGVSRIIKLISGMPFGSSGIMIAIVIFMSVNLNFYTNSQDNIYRLSVQKNITNQINAYSKKNNIRQFDIIVKPHQDDSRGIEYLLKNTFDLSINRGVNNKFIVCYFNKCNPDKNWIKVYQQEKVILYFLKDEIASSRQTRLVSLRSSQ